MTNYPNGLRSFGAPVLPQIDLNPWGRHWFVDGGSGAASGQVEPVGSDGKNGKSPAKAFLTMQKAFDQLQSGDIIWARGNIREQISTPAGVFDVTIIGCRTRHADAHGADITNGGYSSTTWKSPASEATTTPLLTVRQQGWKIYNILFDGPADAAAIQLFRDAGSGDAEDDASHAIIERCKFVAGQNHIEFKGGLSQVELYGNLFFGATADSILETVGAGVGTNNYHRFIGNHWHNNDTHIDMACNSATIYGNTFGLRSGSAAYIDLSGGASNVVWGNYLSGTYSNAGGYTAGTNDEWAGNFNVLSGGVTAADPA